MLKTVATINSSVSPTFTGDVTLSNGNLIIGTSGKGIDFSATPGTGTSELLSDYEEGDWTPAWSVAGGTIVANSNTSGKYVRVGREVTLYGYISYQSHSGSPSGDLSVTGLPFTAGSGFGQASIYSGIATGSGFSWTLGAPEYAHIFAGGTSMSLGFNGATGFTETTFANMTTSSNASQFIFIAKYEV